MSVHVSLDRDQRSWLLQELETPQLDISPPTHTTRRAAVGAKLGGIEGGPDWKGDRVEMAPQRLCETRRRGGRLERAREDNALKRGRAWLYVTGRRDCAQIVVDDG